MTIHIICVEYILEILALLLFYYIQINKNVTRQSDVTVVLLTYLFVFSSEKDSMRKAKVTGVESTRGREKQGTWALT